MKLADELSVWGNKRAHFLGNAKGDGKLTFDRLTDVYHSGTRHEDDQPTHLVIADLDICNSRCGKEFGNPCQYFCPAAVYEMVEASPADRRDASRRSSFKSTSPTACTARPATSWTPTRSSTGFHPKAAAGPITTACERGIRRSLERASR